MTNTLNIINPKGKNKKLNRLFEIDDDKEEFNIPEGATIELAMSPVLPHDLYYIKYTDDFQSFVDVSCIAILIYITTEIYMAFFRPVDEINLSVVWCSMVILYGIASLSSIALNYLRTSEASLLFVFASLSFILSMLVQLADTKFFDFNLKDAFRNLTTNAFDLIQANMDYRLDLTNDATQKSDSVTNKHSTTSQKIYSQLKTYSTNDLLFTCFIATLSAFIGALLFFPAFRLARLHFLCLKYSAGSKSKRFIYYLSFLLPLMVSLCWFKTNFASTIKVSLESDQKSDNTSETVKQFLNLIKTDQTNYSFKKFKQHFSYCFLNILAANNLKIYLIISVFLLRVLLYRHYAQSYLNLAFELASSIRNQTAKLTNVKYMSTVSSIYQYYGVVASQYVIPLYILLFLSLLLKTLGGYTWCGNSVLCNEFVDSVAFYATSFRSNATSSTNILKKLETSHFNVTLGHSALNTIFTPFVLRSLIGYFTFWTCTIWFAISCFGLLYYQYIDRQVVIDS